MTASPPRSPDAATIGYVTKVFPRFSETFILNEVLAHEAAGARLEIFSLRPPVDGRFHEALASVRAPVTYLPGHRLKLGELWEELAAARPLLPRLGDELGELLHAEPGEACAAVALARAARERGIGHLHAHFATIGTTVARLAARLAGITYTFTAHAKDIFHDGVDPPDLRRKLADAAGCVTVSEFNLRHLRATFGADAARVQRIYNGLDLDAFAYADPYQRPPVVAAVGRLVEKKGFDVLIDACAQLLNRGVRVRCVIVGTGEQEQALRERVARLRLGEVVELTGARTQGAVRTLVQSAAVLTAPCVVGRDGNRDGLPTVLLEAMALGTPCVATDVTGIPEVLRDGDTGLQVAQHDAEALAAAIERLLTDAPLRRRLARNARALVEAEFDVTRQTARLRDLFAAASPRLQGVA